ncbi:MAG: helix-turn-helix transcriptional regulator [Chloroflexi bacterium]|nr:helix-turn-helix transcriptional regulator [Chloroflexota bacterium]
MRKETSFEEFKAELMKDPEFRKEYETLEPQYAMIGALISRRNELKLSQTQLARMVGMQQPAISRLEGGGFNTTVATLFKVADALDLEVQFKPKASCKKTPRNKAKTVAKGG